LCGQECLFDDHPDPKMITAASILSLAVRASA